MKFLISLIGAVGSYILFARFFAHAFLAFLIGAVFFILTWRIYSFFQKKFKKEEKTGLNAASSSDDEASAKLTAEQNRIIEEGIKKLVNIRNLTRKIPTLSIATKVQEIC